MAHNLWRSSRLLYRDLEAEDDEFLDRLFSTDPEAFLNAAPFLPVPQTKASATEFRKVLTEKSLVGALICLPPPSPSVSTRPQGDPTNADGSTASEKSETTKDNKLKPIPIGFVALTQDEPKNLHHRRSELGISMIQEYRGQGYGSEAIQWALQWAFRRANLHRVAICAFAWNERAWKLYAKLGFKHEGRLRDYLWYDGEYQDFVQLSMLEHEWRERYGAALPAASVGQK